MSPPSPAELLGLAAAGFLASAHCAGMCGPYVALCLATPAFGGRPSLPVFGLFTAARLLVYAVLGAVAGAAGQAVGLLALRASSGLAVATGLVAAGMGLSLLGLVPDPLSEAAARRAGPLVRRAMGRLREQSGRPVRRLAAVAALGGVQGLLPCGLVYAFLARAAATAGPAAGALTMLAFGLGTVPALAAFGVFARRLGPGTRELLSRLAGILVAAGGLLLVLRGLAGLGLVPHGALW